MTPSLLRITVLVCVMFCCVAHVGAQTATSGWDQLPDILKRIVAPSFPASDFEITDYGAREGGAEDCKPAFDKAIAACTKAGGGRVVVPDGVWLTNGPIHLDNNVNLHVAKNATIKFGTKFDDYLPHVRSRCEGTVCLTYSPLIYAYQKKNVAVTGSGTLDGQAKATWARWPDKTRPGTKSNEALRELGAKLVPIEERVFYFKPNMIEPYECENVLIEGVTIVDYPFWCIHPTFSKNVTVRKVRLDSHNSNNDGINPDSSTDVLIEDCWLDQSDDAIAIKAGRDQDAWKIGKPSSNIIIRNMPENFEGVAIGSEMSGGVENVFIYDMAYEDGDVLYCKSNLDRGGFIRNIFVKNLKVGKARLMRLRNDYHGYRGGNFPTEFRNIQIDDVHIGEGKDETISITGVKAAPVDDVFINNVTVDKVTPPVLHLRLANNVVLTNVNVAGELQPTNPPLLPPEKAKPKGTSAISPSRSGNWSDISLWQLGRAGSGLTWAAKSAGRLPDGSKEERVIIGKAKSGVTVTLDVDVEDEFDVRIYENSKLVIPEGRTLKVAGELRPDREGTSIHQLGGKVQVGGNLQVDDESPARYVMSGGSLHCGTLSLDEGEFIVDNSAGKVSSITVDREFRTHKGNGGTVTKFIANADGVVPIRCKDLVLENYLGEKLVVDVTNYDHAKHGDLVLIEWTGARQGVFDGGPENPKPRVAIVGARAKLVYDDEAKQIRLTEFAK